MKQACGRCRGFACHGTASETVTMVWVIPGNGHRSEKKMFVSEECARKVHTINRKQEVQ